MRARKREAGNEEYDLREEREGEDKIRRCRRLSGASQKKRYLRLYLPSQITLSLLGKISSTDTTSIGEYFKSLGGHFSKAGPGLIYPHCMITFRISPSVFWFSVFEHQ